MPEERLTRAIDASPTVIWNLLTHMEEFPRYMDAVDRVTVIEQGEGYTITDWVTRMEGHPFRWQERDEFHPDAGRIDYHLTQGDLRRFEGLWQLDPPVGRTGPCEVTLTVRFEFGLPMLQAMLNPVAKIVLRRNMTSMLEGLASAARAIEDGVASS